MTPLRLPWLELAILTPAFGAIWVRFRREPAEARRHALAIGSLTLMLTIGGWVDFVALGAGQADDVRGPLSAIAGRALFRIDVLNAPLLPMGALIYILTILATLRAKIREFSLSRALISESILLATFASATPWGVIAMMILSIVPRWHELARNGQSRRVYLAHMGLFAALLIVGESGISRGASPGEQPLWAILTLTLAMLLRSGVIPLHCWMTDLFEHASFGTALLFVSPMTGAFGAARLVAPVAPEWALKIISVMSLATAIYAAGMALVQRDARRFFCYIFLSHSSLVLVGIETATPIGLTGSLSLWLSVSLALTGFGLVLRCIEARVGRVPLSDYLGLYEQVPMLAGLFLLTGLASVGFPGTAGFISIEMIVQAAMEAVPVVGPLIVIVTALNGLAVTSAYFRIFAGRPRPSSIDLQIRRPERIAVLITTILIIGGGLFPQWGVMNRYHAALGILDSRSGGDASQGGRPARGPAPGLEGR